MNVYKSIDIQWHDEPQANPIGVLACIGEWDGDEDDSHVFYYFDTVEQYEDAKDPSKKSEDFWIVAEYE